MIIALLFLSKNFLGSLISILYLELYFSRPAIRKEFFNVVPDLFPPGGTTEQVKKSLFSEKYCRSPLLAE
jgi:hypothetical protein